ncbi:MAG: hypothetical protein PWQ41_1303 [Bacillota bacterium]|nr:hypothetical protein [Bacillota bacterium]MDK2855217.1 hypothetical protein [Bacillota bacterium]MDK2925529.1 hypothetical protein [Bacillota bacterium]
MNAPLLVGLDAGTSSVKACIFKASGELVRQASQEVPIVAPRPGWAELDLEYYWQAVSGVLRETTAGLEGIAGLGLSVTTPTTVLFAEDGRAVRPGILYLDNRSTGEVSELSTALGGEAAFQEYVGNRPIPSTCSVGTVCWIKREEPESWEKTTKIGFLNTFLVRQLTGELAVDPTTASYSGLLRVSLPYHWDDKLIALAKIPANLLPALRPPYARAGTVTKRAAEETGLPPGLPVAVGSADTAAASFTLGLKRHGDAFESAGTSDVLTFCLEEPNFDPAFLNRAHVLPGRWLAHGAMSTAGGAIDWLRRQVFRELPTPFDLEREGEKSPPGAKGIIFLPYLAGERSPIFDPAARGLWLGLRLNTERADLIRAVYEGVAFALRQIYEKAKARWGFELSSIPCVGGAAQSRLGLQVRADVLGLTYKVLSFQNVAAYGAAMLGGIAGGIFRGPLDPSIPPLSSTGQEFTPNRGNKNLYDKLFSIFDGLYPQIKEAMHALL